MTMLKICVALSVLLLLFVLAYGLIVLGISGPPAPIELRKLGEKYLYYMFNPLQKYFSAESPEGVAAILWDYRGLDTLYETIVLFAAIIGSILIYHEYLQRKGEGKGRIIYGLGPIVGSVSKIVLWLTILVSIAIAFTGQLTPGGGFIGGAAFSVVPILVILAYSPEAFRKIKLTISRSLTIRVIALLVIVLIIILPLFFGGYVFQNQGKIDSPFSYPGRFIDNTPLSGSIFWLNIVELAAVAGAFTLAFIVLALIVSSKDVFRGDGNEN